MAKQQSTKATLATTEVKTFNLATFKQDQIPSAIDSLKAKIKELKGDDEKDNVISGDLPGIGRIEDLKDPNTIVELYAQISQKSKVVAEYYGKFQEVAPTIKVKPWKVGSNSPESVLKALLGQYKKVVFKEELAKYEKAVEKLEKHLSEEEKMKNDLQSVFEVLNIGE